MRWRIGVAGPISIWECTWEGGWSIGSRQECSLNISDISKFVSAVTVRLRLKRYIVSLNRGGPKTEEHERGVGGGSELVRSSGPLDAWTVSKSWSKSTEPKTVAPHCSHSSFAWKSEKCWVYSTPFCGTESIWLTTAHCHATNLGFSLFVILTAEWICVAGLGGYSAGEGGYSILMYHHINTITTVSDKIIQMDIRIAFMTFTSLPAKTLTLELMSISSLSVYSTVTQSRQRLLVLLISIIY